jgi:hypothetical protein
MEKIIIKKENQLVFLPKSFIETIKTGKKKKSFKNVAFTIGL